MQTKYVKVKEKQAVLDGYLVFCVLPQKYKN